MIESQNLMSFGIAHARFWLLDSCG
jgi:hypothetical protein